MSAVSPQVHSQTYMSASPEKARYQQFLGSTAPALDWKALAAGAWDPPSWKEAAADYHEARNGRPSIVEIEPEKLRQLRKLMDDGISLERVWDDINRAARARYNAAPQPTEEALMYSLRERGVKALAESATQRRLSKLSDAQMIEVGERLRRLKPKIARAWSADEVATLIQFRERLK